MPDSLTKPDLAHQQTHSLMAERIANLYQANETIHAKLVFWRLLAIGTIVVFFITLAVLH